MSIIWMNICSHYDKKIVYHLFGDYFDKLTIRAKKELFDKENPYLIEFLSGKNINLTVLFLVV